MGESARLLLCFSSLRWNAAQMARGSMYRAIVAHSRSKLQAACGNDPGQNTARAAIQRLGNTACEYDYVPERFCLGGGPATTPALHLWELGPSSKSFKNSQEELASPDTLAAAHLQVPRND